MKVRSNIPIFYLLGDIDLDRERTGLLIGGERLRRRLIGDLLGGLRARRGELQTNISMITEDKIKNRRHDAKFIAKLLSLQETLPIYKYSKII